MTEKRQYRQVMPEHVDCKAFRNDIIGYTEEQFCDRPVVLFRQRPGIFGATSVKKIKIRKYTLHNGILNQCAVHSDGHPGIYWAVLDAMSDMKTDFTKEQVVKQAVDILKRYDGRFRGNAKKAATTAFYILKTHMTHPARKNMGFGFIVESFFGDRKRMFVRVRKESEISEEKPIATILVNERG